MIKFFRRIRKKLLSDLPAGKAGNRLSKYLVYAGGEIILVMIGILLALQVNNWNENRKQAIKERGVLEELKLGLESNKSILENRKKRFAYYKSKSKILIEHLEAKRAYHDSLDYYFYIPVANYSFGISDATFENLKSQGLDIITNKVLRLDIVKLYEEDFWALKDSEMKMSNLLSNTTIPLTRKHFKVMPGGKYKPNNYKEILENQEILNLMYESNFLAQNYFDASVGAIEAISELIEKLDEELEG